MTAPRKPDLARGMKHALRLAEQRVDELAEMSDADFERAMAALPPPARVPSLEELLDGAKRKAADRGAEDEAKGLAAPAKVVAMPARGAGRTRWTLWLVAAALGAVAVTVFVERRAVMALFHGPERTPILPLPEPPPVPAADRAEALRVEADEACAVQHWGTCKTRLDEAQAIDPAGESTPRVQALRKAIHDHTTYDPESESKVPRVPAGQ